MSAQHWYIYGAGGLGVETLDILSPLLAQKQQVSVKFTIDDEFISQTPKLIHEIPVIGFSKTQTGQVTIAIGEPALRDKVMLELANSTMQLASIISQHAIVSPYASIGAGCIVAPLCSIQARATLKDNVAVNTSAIIGHDVVVEQSSVISSQVNLGGGVHIGKASYIGMGALIKEGVRIGDNVIIGMGSVVHKDIPDGVIAMGNPARPLKKNTEQKVFK